LKAAAPSDMLQPSGPRAALLLVVDAEAWLLLDTGCAVAFGRR
jgi:hypothetical protein